MSNNYSAEHININTSQKEREDEIRLEILKETNQKNIDNVNIMLLDRMTIGFIDKYLRKRKLNQINETKIQKY